MSDVMDSSLGGSSLVSKTETSFDIRKESDVIGLLRLVHVNAIDPEIKNHLRDLIFAYRQTLTPDDAEKVAQSFKAMGIVVVYKDEAPQTAPEPVTVKTLGSTRPAPRFVSVPPKSASTLPKEVAQPAQEPAAVKSESAPVPEPTQPIVEVEVKAVGSRDASERIKVIKRTINEKVGNPVNLIETHGDLGRVYMSALLDAMKKVNGATASELASAMARLENAFRAVENALKGVDVPVKKEEVVPAPQVVVPQATPEPIAAAVSTDEVKVAVERTDSPIRLTVSSEMAHTTPKLSSVRANLAAIAELDAPQTPEPPVMPSTPEPIKPEEPALLVQEETPLSVPEVVPEQIHSVAKEKQLQELLRSTKHRDAVNAKESEEMRRAAMDPLATPEVNAGLAQLLSEWSLFKSSGIFGTGPNGSDHPLYKKISGLTMAAVIAGRFEGATPGIKQSITDYMNGWRYEESIVHEHTETFEHYLRRVVRQILSHKGQK